MARFGAGLKQKNAPRPATQEAWHGMPTPATCLLEDPDPFQTHCGICGGGIAGLRFLGPKRCLENPADAPGAARTGNGEVAIVVKA